MSGEIFAYGQVYADAWALTCPACGSHYAHLREVGALRGSDPHEGAPPPGVRVVGQTGERRAAVELVYDGECGHAWTLRFQQHKGVELVQVAVLRAPAPPDGPAGVEEAS